MGSRLLPLRGQPTFASHSYDEYGDKTLGWTYDPAGNQINHLSAGQEDLTADHLGTPVLATDASGSTIWSGGFTPFGEPYQLMPPTLFLRLPGQWTDATWEGLVA